MHLQVCIYIYRILTHSSGLSFVPKIHDSSFVIGTNTSFDTGHIDLQYAQKNLVQKP